MVEEQLPDYYDDDPPAWIRPFRDDPDRAFAELADGLAAFWAAAMAPHWPAMRAALDEEVLHRARALAAQGPDALLSDLHQRVIWERPVLTLVKPLEQSFSAVDKRLLLIPLIFSRGALMCSTDHPEVVAVSYQARGAAVLAEGRPEPAPDRLAILIGRGRAAVLDALSRPSTTAGLAATLGLAPSTVSEHLAALTAAGVVNRRRAGRRVLYSPRTGRHRAAAPAGRRPGPPPAFGVAPNSVSAEFVSRAGGHLPSRAWLSRSRRVICAGPTAPAPGGSTHGGWRSTPFAVSTSTSAGASCSACSARTAPARRPPSRCSTPCSSRPPAARGCAASTWSPRPGRYAGGSGTSSAATAGSTTGCPRWTTCVTSPSCTACRPPGRSSGSASCSSWSG